MPGSSVFNITRALDYMKRCDVDVLIATSAYNVRYFTGYSCWLDSLFKAHMMWPGDSSRLLSPSYAFVCLTGELGLVVAASTAVNAAHLGDVHLHCYGDPGVDFTLRSDSPSRIEQRYLDLFQHCSGNATAFQGLVSALTERGLSGASIGIELDGVPKEVSAEIFQSLPRARWRDCTNLIRLIRAVKT